MFGVLNVVLARTLAMSGSNTPNFGQGSDEVSEVDFCYYIKKRANGF